MEKYYKMLGEIQKQKIDMVKLFILSSVKMTQDTQKEEWKIVKYCYDLWLNADVDLDLSRLADIVTNNWENIKNDKYLENEIIEDCLNY